MPKITNDEQSYLPPILHLPEEIKFQICKSFANRYDLAPLAKSCSSFFSICNDERILKSVPWLFDYSEVKNSVRLKSEKQVLAMALSPNGNLLAMVSLTHLQLGDLHAKRYPIQFLINQAHGKEGSAPEIVLAFTQDNCYLVISYHYFRTYWDDTPPPLDVKSSEHSHLEVWDVANRKLLHQFDHLNSSGGEQRITVPDGHKFIVGYYGKAEDQWVDKHTFLPTAHYQIDIDTGLAEQLENCDQVNFINKNNKSSIDRVSNIQYMKLEKNKKQVSLEVNTLGQYLVTIRNHQGELIKQIHLREEDAFYTFSYGNYRDIACSQDEGTIAVLYSGVVTLVKFPILKNQLEQNLSTQETKPVCRK